MGELPESIRRLWGVPANHDLPPSWDGVPITWHEWTVSWSTLEFHLPLHETACDQCGGLGTRGINWGTRTTEDGTQCRDIVASRCQDCGHDTVTDHRTNETWDLEAEDYTDLGSNPPDMETLF